MQHISARRGNVDDLRKIYNTYGSECFLNAKVSFPKFRSLYQNDALILIQKLITYLYIKKTVGRPARSAAMVGVTQ